MKIKSHVLRRPKPDSCAHLPRSRWIAPTLWAAGTIKRSNPPKWDKAEGVRCFLYRLPAKSLSAHWTSSIGGRCYGGIARARPSAGAAGRRTMGPVALLGRI